MNWEIVGLLLFGLLLGLVGLIGPLSAHGKDVPVFLRWLAFNWWGLWTGAAIIVGIAIGVNYPPQ